MPTLSQSVALYVRKNFTVIEYRDRHVHWENNCKNACLSTSVINFFQIFRSGPTGGLQLSPRPLTADQKQLRQSSASIIFQSKSCIRKHLQIFRNARHLCATWINSVENLTRVKRKRKVQSCISKKSISKKNKILPMVIKDVENILEWSFRKRISNRIKMVPIYRTRKQACRIFISNAFTSPKQTPLLK